MGYGLRVSSDMFVSFLSGAVMMGCLGIGLFFLKFWKKTSDRFFILFAVAFGILALERLVSIRMDLPSEPYPIVYILRLFAFLLILAAIIDKNWKSH